MEFAPFADIFGWARNDYHYNVEVTTCGFSKTVVSCFGIPITVDLLIDEIIVDEYEALAIPGGFEEYGFYEEVYDERIVIDDNVITSFCPETAADVGFALLSKLVGAERAEVVKSAMGY